MTKKLNITLDGGTIEDEIKEMKEFLGLTPEQSFDDIEKIELNGEIPITTNRTLEEIEKAIETKKQKSAKLTDWENVDTVYEE